MKCLCKYSIEVSRFILEILKTLKVIASVILRKCEKSFVNTKANKGEP